MTGVNILQSLLEEDISTVGKGSTVDETRVGVYLMKARAR